MSRLPIACSLTPGSASEGNNSGSGRFGPGGASMSQVYRSAIFGMATPVAGFATPAAPALRWYASSEARIPTAPSAALSGHGDQRGPGSFATVTVVVATVTKLASFSSPSARFTVMT